MNTAAAALILLSLGLPVQTDATGGAASASRSEDRQRTAADRADILSALPGELWASLVVRDLAGFDGKVAPLLAKRGLPVLPHQFVKAWLGIVQGIDDHGSAAVVLMPVDEDHPAPEQLAVLLPTTDRTLLTTFWDPQELTSGYFGVTVAGRESFLGTKGDFSVIGPKLETIAGIVESKNALGARLSVQVRERAAAGDVTLWINTAEVASSAFPNTYQSWLRDTLGLEKDFLKPYKGVQLAARIEPEGLALGLYVEGTETTGDMASPDAGESLLRGLPDERCVFALGMVNDNAGRQLKSLGRLAISALIAAKIVDPGRAADFQKLYASMAPDIAAASVSISALPRGTDSLFGLTKVLRARGDSRAILREVEGVVGLFRSGPFVDPKMNAMLEKLAYRRAVEMVGEVSVDHLWVEFEGEEPEEYVSLKKVVGAEGILARIGAVDGKNVVITFGGGLARFAGVVEAVRAGGAPLAGDPGIAKSARHVAADRSLEAYFSVDRFMRLARRVGTAMDRPVQFPELPELNAPVSASVQTVGPGATQVDIFIPTEVLTQPFAPPPQSLPGP